MISGPRAWAAPASATAALDAARERIAIIEKREGGRLGVAVLDSGNGRRLGYRENERFALCSTFKFLVVAALLSRVDRGKERLDRRIVYRQSDLLDYAPVTKEHLKEGGMTLAGLCEAAIELSDNTAANLILRNIGGPAGLTRYLRSLGDPLTRLDRTEPALNTAIPGDERDTTSPAAMVKDMNRLLLRGALSKDSRGQLERWLIDCKTGAARLRAGLPSDWQVGDKTGTGDHGTANDIAILRPPGRAPLLVASYFTESRVSSERRDAVHAELGRIIAATF